MIRSKIFFAAIVVLCCAAALGAQQMLLNQAYLNQFPSPERVRAEMKGSDEVDTHARFMAALMVLNDFMLNDLLRAPNGGYYNMPPAADRAHEKYYIAITSLTIDHPEPPSKDPRFRPLRDKYEKDPAFADMILQKFFTPQFRADYYAWTRKPMPAGGNTTASASAAVAPAASADPSIAKARAAKIDLGLFAGSIKFGEPLMLPRCPYTTGIVGQPELGDITQDCENIPPPMTGMAGDLLQIMQSMVPASQAKPGPTPDPNLKGIILVDEHKPAWMSGNRAGVTVSPNGIERVFILTRGRAVENRVTQDLKAKYGPATITHNGTITPHVGNAFDVHNQEWILPGMRIEYMVIEVDADGQVQTDGPGYVRIETESAYQRRIAEEKKANK
ncbi:MAG TPA: hypothetical protein VEV84_02660, partial [Pyrinomonadaceae bacterium]|nr:hypothetical protein [Pyrinomonadaceae bacterium]